MSTVDVFRRRPPEVQRCRGKGCNKLVEWVLVGTSGRRMPVTHPLLPVREHEREDGSMLTVIDGETVHFNTCPAADTFRKTRRASKPKRPKQGDLFRDLGDR